VAFVSEIRRRREAASDSEALDLLLKEMLLEDKRRDLDAAFKAYYDTAGDEELLEQREWAEGTGPNMFAGIPE
jgi:hypothetical protein